VVARVTQKSTKVTINRSKKLNKDIPVIIISYRLNSGVMELQEPALQKISFFSFGIHTIVRIYITVPILEYFFHKNRYEPVTMDYSTGIFGSQ